MIIEDPTDPFCQYALALEYASDSQYFEEAIDLLNALRRKSPDYLPLYYQLAVLLHKTGKTESAINIAKLGAELALDQQNRHTFREISGFLEELEED